MKRLAQAILLGGTLLVLAMPPSAFAHAQLVGTVPGRGAVLKHEPPAVVLHFDEPVEGNFGAVRVYSANGNRVDEGGAFHPNGEGPRLGVRLKPGLPDGSYTATYSVVSDDGHIVSSSFIFSVGKPGRALKQTAAELTRGAGNGPVTETAFGLARGLQYAATALAVGGLAFLLLTWSPGLGAVEGSSGEWGHASRAFARRFRAVLLVATILGAFSAAAAIVLEGAEAAGVSGFSALKETIVRETLETKFGTVWGLTALAWIAFGLLVIAALGSRRRRRPGPLHLMLAAVPMAFVVMEPALAGHGSTQSPTALLFPANVLHVAAIAIWLGGLAMLLFIVPPAIRELTPPAERSRLLAALLSRFSQVALISVAAILLTGLIQAYVYVRHLDALTETGYGRAVLAKLVLLMALVAIAAYNRRRLVPRLGRIAAGGQPPGRAGLLLRRALCGEVALLIVVLGVTAALASYAPPVVAQSSPLSTDAPLGPPSSR